MQTTGNLAQRRRALGLSQQQVAFLAGCSVTRVGQIEREPADAPATPVREAIAAALAEKERATSELPAAA